jgi:cytoskeletal protein CcmA (bactofilin family)
MFTRNKTETDDHKPSAQADDLAIPIRPTPANPPRGVPVPARPPAMPPRIPDSVRTADPSRRSGDPQPRSEGDVRRLVVGREITLSGTITRCDQLVVEGSIEAHLTDCRDIQISESGLFKGSATIEEAEIRGRFEGDLVVKKRLMIKATGRVVGTIRYGQIEIECGGQIIGEIHAEPGPETERMAAAQ